MNRVTLVLPICPVGIANGPWIEREEMDTNMRISGEVLLERQRAHNKHVANGGSMEVKYWFDDAWLPVLVEEVGEVASALCEYRHLKTIPDILKKELRAELIQVAAMTMAWIDAIDRRDND